MGTQAITQVADIPPQHEFIDSKVLAQRLGLPESWVREYVRTRVLDPIPHYKMGKYVLFKWGSPELESWLQRHFVAGKSSKRDSGSERIQ